jgi:SAM-dependent methyltransferase
MKEKDIRPANLIQKYTELSAKDAKYFFKDVPRKALKCIACKSQDTSFQFNKHSFEYVLCNECGSLFQSPRPVVEAFEEFYKDSESSRYWAEVFFPFVSESRREKIYKPRVKRLMSMCNSVDLEVLKLIDVGAGYGIFLDEWRALNPATELLAIEPSLALAKDCRKKNIKVVESIVEKVKDFDDYADLIVCFEVLEHVNSPIEFINVLKKLVRPGGYIFISTLCIDGFDLQVLWDKSSQISPPHHINFHSIKGFQSLFERAGFDDIIIETPGQLDVDIVLNFFNKNPDELQNNRFFKSLIDEDKAKAFQSFLKDNKFSSHAWIMAKKPENL